MRYCIEYGIEMLDQFVITKALDAESMASKKNSAPSISDHIRRGAVLASIELND